jgi:hypothetical protein
MAAHDILIIEYPFIGIHAYTHIDIYTHAPLHINFYLCDDNGGIHARSPSIRYFRNEDYKRLCEVIY